MNINSRVKDLTNKKFGKLLVISFAGISNSRSKWNCLCDCGNKTIVLSNNLRSHKNNYCGKCYKLDEKEALARIIFRDYRHRAKYDNMEFTLSLEDTKRLISNDCFYCGSPPLNTKTRNKRTFPYNGIDRIDSNKGYTQNNTRSCCGICNTMKLDYTENEFKAHILKIFNKWIQK